MINQPFFVPALVIIFMAIPLVLGLIPRNRIYGVRIPKTLSDDGVWYRTNRFGGWVLIVSGAIYLIVAKIFPTSGPHDPDYSLWLLHLVAFVLPLIISVMLAIRYARNL